MKKAINLLFWGYIYVLIRIDFGIDIVPVPLGYFIIATGCKQLEERYPFAEKVWAFATAMIFISFPTIFLDVHQETALLWQTYSLIVLTGQLIVVYFILRLVVKIVVDYGNPLSVQRFKLLTNVYVIGHLIYLFAMTFTVNLAVDQWLSFMGIFMSFVFIMDIIFLVSLKRARNLLPEILEQQ